LELQRFSAQGFRNLADLEMSPASGMNVIYGANAQGKTNLLEAIFVLSTLRSFRTRLLPESLRFGEASALLQGSVKNTQSKHLLSVFLQEGKKVAMLDRKNVSSLNYLGVFDVFLFSFPFLEIIRGGPEERRRFLDRSITISRPGYLPVLLQYHRAVRQKTALLLSLQRGEVNRKDALPELASFNQQLLQHGLEIVGERVEYLNRLQELVSRKQQLFFEKDLSLGIELKSSFLGSREDVERNLDRIVDREIAAGFCLLGPHRDEICMSVDDRELRKYGSSGQHRAFLLLLLLSQLELYERWREERPVLLLDDLDSELDEKRIQAFLGEVRNRYQTFLSSSREGLFFQEGNAGFFEIREGSLLERS
jgi:DNA replication and repair protein RecF